MAKNSSVNHLQKLKAKDEIIKNQDNKFRQVNAINLSLQNKIVQLSKALDAKDQEIARLTESLHIHDVSIEKLQTEYNELRCDYEKTSEYRFSKEALECEKKRLKEKYPFLPNDILSQLGNGEFLYFSLGKNGVCFDVILLEYAKVFEAILKAWLRKLAPGKWHPNLLFGETLLALHDCKKYDPDIHYCDYINRLRDRAAHSTNNPVNKAELEEVRGSLLNKWINKVFMD